MRRPVWFRALLAIWGLWFTTALTDAGGLHSCPMHGNHAMHAGAQAGSAHDAPMDAESHHAAPTPANSEHREPGHDACTCMGLCCCAAPIGLAQRAHEVLVATLPVKAVAAQHPEIVVPRLERPYALPFANGPPAQA